MKGLYIDGAWKLGKGAMLRSVDPFNHQILWQKKTASAAQVEMAVRAAGKAQLSWHNTTCAQRSALIKKFTVLLNDHRDELVATISSETGKPIWEANAEIDAMIRKADITIEAHKERAGQWDKDAVRLRHRPHGVMAVYGPYNFPGHLPNGHIMPALLAGNTVVFKPSEWVPHTAEKIVALWHNADLPPGVLNLVQGGGLVGAALSRTPINGLLFTGSAVTGRTLHRQFAGKPEILLALEMGGNNALIVDDDISNLDAVVRLIILSAYASAGQRCTCARRLIIVRSSRSDQLLQTLAAAVDRLIVGRYDSQPEPFMGPLIHHQAVQALLRAEKKLRNLGGTILRSMAEGRTDNTSNLLRPGIVQVDGCAVPDEEWFGPLLQVNTAGDFDAALRIANNTRFGLAAGLISNNVQHHEQFTANIRAGVIAINRPTTGAPSTLPFGGIGHSGNYRPSAYYAADYCAWPQAQSYTDQMDTPLPIPGLIP